MTELVENTTEPLSDATTCVVNLLRHYGFDLGGSTISQLLLNWQEHYPATWMRLATIEALYQGRYKAISVEQILAMWQRRSQPLYHFNHEFERLVCDKLPEEQVLSAPSPQSELFASRSTALNSKLPYHSVALQLPSFEAALPESDVMLALRTLHSKEMAILAEGVLAEGQPLAEAQNPPEADEPASSQTYSYTLSSNGRSSEASLQEPNADSVQNEATHTARSLEALDGIASEVSSTTLQDESISLEHEHPPTANQPADNAAAPAVPPTDAQARSPFAQRGSIAKILQQLDHQELNAKTPFPGLGLLTPKLKQTPQLNPATLYQPIWLADASSNQPIHQFTPALELPEFYSKLKEATPSPKLPKDDTLSE